MDGYSTERVNKLREIEFDYTYLTNERWKEIIAVYLRGAKNFEIHCWDEETEEIASVLFYGELKDWLAIRESNCRPGNAGIYRFFA